MYIKEVLLFIIVAASGGFAGYLYYLYFERKRKKEKEKLNKTESMLTSIFTFAAAALCGFLISHTDNYFYMFLIFIGINIGAALILAVLLRRKKPREDKNSYSN